MKREEDIDLFCTELLSQGDAHSYHPEVSYLKIDCEPLSSVMVDIPSAFCGAVDPYLYSLLMSPVSKDCNNFQQRSLTGVGCVPSPFRGAEGISASMGPLDHRSRDDHHWNDTALIDGIGWRDFSPEHRFSSMVRKQDRWQSVEAETYLPLGHSLQSKSLTCEHRTAQACGLCSLDKQRWFTGSIAGCRSSNKLESSLATENLHSKIIAYYHEGDHVSDPGKAWDTNRSVCTLEFRDAMEFLLEKESATNYQLSSAYIKKLTGQPGQKLDINGIRSTRKNFVNWILKVVEHLQMSALTGAHAVSFFDRNLSERLALDSLVEDNDELLLAATACVWIAAKLEDSCVPRLSRIQALAAVGFDDVQFRKMEFVVLSSLGWRTLGATANDFLVNMIAQLRVLGLPAHLLTSLGCRSEEVMRIVLPEVEFLVYQPSVVSFSVMQFLLDEYVPVQTASLMAAFHLALAVDVESKEDCNRALNNLVKPRPMSVLQSPGRACVDFKNYSDFHSDSSNPDFSKEQSTRLPIPAF